MHKLIRTAKQRSLMFLLGLLTALDFFENSMFVFASSHVMGGINATPREFAQIQAVYAIGSLLMIVNQQWLTRYFSYRSYLVTSLGLFVMGTLWCSSSTTFISLCAGRFVQGFGGGALFTTSRILINLLFEPAFRGRALKYFILMIFSASAVGPYLAAQMVDTFGWQSIFWAAFPPACVAILLCWWLLPSVSQHAERSTFPTLSFALFATAIISLQFILADAQFDFTADSFGLWFSLFGVVSLLIGFLWLQYHHKNPIIMVRKLHNSVYISGLGLYFLYYLLNSCSGYLFPIFAEQGFHFPLITVGWLNSCAGLFSLVIAYGYLKLARKITHKKYLMVFGALSMVATACFFSTLSPNARAIDLLPGLLFKGIFSILLVLPIAGLTFKELGEAHFGHGYQGKNIMRQIASSLATATAAVMAENRYFAVQSELSSTLVYGRPNGMNWQSSSLTDVTTLQRLAEMVEQQARIISIQNLYTVMAVVALITAVIIAFQNKIR